MANVTSVEIPHFYLLRNMFRVVHYKIKANKFPKANGKIKTKHLVPYYEIFITYWLMRD